MSHSVFRGAHAWVFDLDNTLYPPSARLFEQIVAKMNAYVMRELGVDNEEAHRIRETYWRKYGTTLAGLMHENGIDADDFLDDVHDIDLSILTPDAALIGAIAALPGRKIVYTNGSRGHADRVLAARGLAGLFDARYGVEDAEFAPKPQRAAFERVFGLDRLTPRGAVMVEDDIRNLTAPRQMGMRTLWVTDAEAAKKSAPHIDAATHDLAAFLTLVQEP